MKRLVFFLLFAISATATNAQVFGTPGSTWWIQGFMVASGKVQKIWYKNDTLIQGKTYKNFKGICMEEFGYNEPTACGLNIPPVYVSNDTVAIGPPNNLQIQYTFNANIGDSWGNVIVVAKFDTLINGQTLRAMRLRKAQHYTATLVIEKIGGGNFLPYMWDVIDSATINGPGIDNIYVNNLVCFQSDELGFLHTGWYQTLADCDYLLSVPETPANLLSLYPNPTSSIISLSGLKNRPYIYSLYNSAGQLVKQANNTSNTIDITDKPAGLYFVKISLPNGYSQAFKVVKN